MEGGTSHTEKYLALRSLRCGKKMFPFFFIYLNNLNDILKCKVFTISDKDAKYIAR